MIAVLERRGEGTSVKCEDKEIPLEIIRYTERRLAGFATRLDGLGGKGEPPGGGHSSYPGRLPDALALYFDVQRALKVMASSPRRPADAATLRLIVVDRLQGYSFSEVARRMQQKKRRRLRGGGLWSKDGIESALDRVYTWLCNPALGAVLTWDEWNRCLVCQREEKLCRLCPSPA